MTQAHTNRFIVSGLSGGRPSLMISRSSFTRRRRCRMVAAMNTLFASRKDALRLSHVDKQRFAALSLHNTGYRLVEVKLYKGIDGKKVFEGILEGLEDGNVRFFHESCCNFLNNFFYLFLCHLLPFVLLQSRSFTALCPDIAVDLC